MRMSPWQWASHARPWGTGWSGSLPRARPAWLTGPRARPRVPTQVEARFAAPRQAERRGRDKIAAERVMPARTVSRILARHHPRLTRSSGDGEVGTQRL